MEKIKKILIQNKVKISKNGKICLNNLIDVTKNGTNKKKIHEFAKKKVYEEDGHLYVGKNMTLKILEKYDTKISKKILSELGDYDNESYISSEISSQVDIEEENKEENKKELQDYDGKFSLDGDLLEYAGKKFKFVDIDRKIYFRGKDVAEFLEYKNTKSAIIDNVKEKYKIKLVDLFRGGETPPLTYNEKNTIYIMEAGLWQLVTNSKKKEAEQFQDILYEKILPSIRKIGSYSSNSQVSFDLSFIPSIYDEENISDFDNRNVVYLIAVGFLNNNLLIKYGVSSDFYRREFQEHRKSFGNYIKVLFIYETDNNIRIEKLFEKDMKSKGLYKEVSINNKNKRELFCTSDKFKLNDAKDLMIKLINKFPLDSIKERDAKIKNLEESIDHRSSLLIEKERTKQIEISRINNVIIQKEKTKRMQMQYKMFKINNKIDAKSSSESDNDESTIIESLNNDEKISKIGKIEYKQGFVENKYKIINITTSKTKGKNQK